MQDFIFNRKQGHCEYFASAMVLLLALCGCAGAARERVQGGGVQPAAGALHHSPVRRPLLGGGLSGARWLAHFRDPSVLRSANTPQPTMARQWWRNTYDSMETLWVKYVLDYDYEQQNEMFKSFYKAMDAIQALWIRAVYLAGGSTLAINRQSVSEWLKWLATPMKWGVLRGHSGCWPRCCCPICCAASLRGFGRGRGRGPGGMGLQADGGPSPAAWSVPARVDDAVGVPPCAHRPNLAGH